MPEIGEGGIKGFLKRIRGQTAKKEVAKPTTKVPEIQITQEEAERRRVLAENRRKQLQLVIHTDHVAIPDSVDIQNAVLEIEKGVTARSIEGKFPPEVRIKERIFHHSDKGGYGEDGDSEAIGIYSGKLFTSLLASFGSILHEREDFGADFQELAKKHFLMAVNVPGTQDAILSYHFLQNWRDGFGRSAATVSMNFRLGREGAYKLLDLVRKNPEVAEMFLHTAAEGFEADNPNSPKVGIPRVKSDEVVIVNFDRFNQDSLLSGSRESKIVEEMVQNKNGQIERLKYSTPHGVADPNTIP